MAWVFYNFYSQIWIRIGEILKYYGGVIKFGGFEKVRVKIFIVIDLNGRHTIT